MCFNKRTYLSKNSNCYNHILLKKCFPVVLITIHNSIHYYQKSDENKII